MPRLIVSSRARMGVLRCHRFLSDKSPLSARRAAEVIERSLMTLESSPEIGRPCFERPGFRELLIAFGDAGYVALYRYERAADAVFVMAFRHQKEAGY